ncbi:uncharacterized protein EHS24_001285 [Apiotrichum porosum]|uniref:DJ-1/PfpI domain-containing protein n=1 Tax=Apiotrichum porosum TaxID=105984 RepID=A0A427XK75_9TREE|nr:uncharacterized protein EHS24_001285 [Apiotrichum porosum]RSH79246.1 hypothetical protein EHS24_001285 [Apiotrichum porosum]
MSRSIGFLVFPNIQLLDLTGPYDILAALPHTALHLVSRTLDPVMASSGMYMLPTSTYETCPKLDMLVVPGGIGIGEVLLQEDAIEFVRQRASEVELVTAVCSGSLVLGVAGLLRGKKATTHWAFHALLASLGAEPVKSRVVRDGNLITGAGGTAGIDFALAVMAHLEGDELAQTTQLYMEYAPEPPFDCGTPERAGPEIMKALRSVNLFEQRRKTIEQALKMHKTEV